MHDGRLHRIHGLLIAQEPTVWHLQTSGKALGRHGLIPDLPSEKPNYECYDCCTCSKSSGNVR
jgi:hypothetical protein